MNSRSKFTVVSTFSGCGGSSLGYQMAGGKVLLAVEWNGNAVATYRLNFPTTPIYSGDITKLSADECCRLAGIEPGGLDVLDGSPPCQGFSSCGKRLLEDERNQLFKEYVRLLRGLRPKCFVMENVGGMVKGKMKLLFAECLGELKTSGYRVRARLINAMYFNVPQSRARLIFIGVREDLPANPSHPAAMCLPISVRKAWEGIREPSDASKLSERYQAYWRRAGLGGQVGKFSQVRRLRWNKPSTVLTKGGMGTFHPSECRRISSAELKRLATFPDDFQFRSRWSVKELIGNAVPPLFMKAIAEHVRDVILSRCDAGGQVRK